MSEHAPVPSPHQQSPEPSLSSMPGMSVTGGDVTIDATTSDPVVSDLSSGCPSPETGRAAAFATALESAPRVAGYRVIGRIGEGGMGTVWRAEQLSTRREVALKFMNAAYFGSPRARGRFEREVELTARLSHAGIARVYDSGLRDGVCYFAMELVDVGLPLDAFVRSHKLPQRDIVRLMSAVCDAVQHAHERGVIHRDLKPGNILVLPDGQPKVLDFGLAKALLETTHSDSAALQVSVEGDVSGTPAFMSPEQAAGRSREADTRSDVYSLGVILYLLLTGRFPHPLEGPRTEVLKRIAETEVDRPRKYAPSLDAELEAVLLKALSSESERRYASAGALGEDLKRYLQGDPVIARAPTLSYILAKRVRRHQKLVTLVAATVLVVLAAGIWSYFSIRTERDLTAQANVEKERQRIHAVQQEQLATAAFAEAQIRRAEGMVSEARALTLAGLAPQARARFAEAAGRLKALGRPTLEAELGVFDCHLRYPQEIWETAAHQGAVAAVALLPDGRTAISAGLDGELLRYDLPSGRRLSLGHHPQLRKLAVSGNGRIAISGGGDGTLKLWDLFAAKELKQTARTANPWVDALAINFDATSALSITREADTKTYAIQKWDLVSGTASATVRRDAQVGFSRNDITSALFHASGELICFNHKVYRLESGSSGPELSEQFDVGFHVPEMAISGNGKFLVCTGDRTPSVWSLDEKRLVRTLHGHATKATTAVAYGAGPEKAMTGGQDNAVRVWDLATGETTMTLLGHESAVTAVAVEPTIGLAMSGDRDGHIRIWFTARRSIAGAFLPTGQRTGERSIKGMSPDGRLLLAADRHQLVLYSADAGREIRRWDAHPPGASFAAAMSPDGRSAASVDVRDGILRQWDLETGEKTAEVPGFATGRRLCYSPDGRLIAVAGRNGNLWLWNGNAKAQPVELGKQDATISAVAVTSDGGSVVTGDYKGQIFVWNVATRASRHVLAHQGVVETVVISQDGHWLMSGGGDRAIRVFDLQTLRETRSWTAAGADVKSLALFPDGRNAVSVDMEGIARFWDVGTGRELVRTSPGGVWGSSSVTLARHGELIALLDRSQNIQLWDLSYPARASTLRTSASEVRRTSAPNTDDPVSLKVLGEWFALSAPETWAIDALQRSRAGGQAISPQLLGTCYWRLGRREDAAAEFRRALESASGSDESRYLRMCLRSLETARTP